jgi:hypothetical protein
MFNKFHLVLLCAEHVFHKVAQQNVVGDTNEIRAGQLRNKNQMRYRMMQLALLGISVVQLTNSKVW